jgi:hypothetical protein
MDGDVGGIGRQAADCPPSGSVAVAGRRWR